ncbi:MAG TPA: hypothetical protein VGD62_12920 [Acidobacteriaceae bacterium]
MLTVLWGLQGVFALVRHAPRQACLMFAIAAFFAVVGRIVHRRDPSR